MFFWSRLWVTYMKLALKKQLKGINSKSSAAIKKKKRQNIHIPPLSLSTPMFDIKTCFLANVPHMMIPEVVITLCSHYAKIASQPSAVLGGLLCGPQKLTLASKLSSCLVERLGQTFQLPPGLAAQSSGPQNPTKIC